MKENQIIQLAENTLNQFRQFRAPIAVDKIAEGLGIQVVQGNLGEKTSGVIYREENRTKIGINATQSLTRRRFTLAHELGHYLIHQSQPLWVDTFAMFRDESSVGDPCEVEANKFAAELLMPRRLLGRVKIPREEAKADRCIKDLAIDFDVSARAMSIRLVNLQLIEMY